MSGAAAKGPLVQRGLSFARYEQMTGGLSRIVVRQSLRPFGPPHLRAKSRLRRLRSETRLRAQPLHKGGFCAFGARNNNLQNQKIAMIGIVAIFRVLMYNVSNVYF